MTDSLIQSVILIVNSESLLLFSYLVSVLKYKYCLYFSGTTWVHCVQWDQEIQWSSGSSCHCAVRETSKLCGPES